MKTMVLNGKNATQHLHLSPLDIEATVKTVPAQPPAVVAPTAQPATPPAAPHRSWKLLALLVAIIVASVYGVREWRFAQTHQSTDDAFIDGRIIAVAPRVAGHVLHLYVDDNQQVKQGDLLVQLDPADFQVRVDQARASLEAAQRRLQTAQLTVNVTHHTSFGGYDQARAGVAEATATVSKADDDVAVNQANVTVAEQRVAQAAAQTAAAQASERQAQAEVRRAAVEEDRSAKDERRYQQLFKEQFVSQQQLDDTTAAHRSAEQALAAARSQALAAQSQISAARSNETATQRSLAQTRVQVSEAGAAATLARAQVHEANGKLRSAAAAPQQLAVSRTDVLSAKAAVLQAQAALHQAELELSYTRIRAPQDGRVTKRLVEQGDYFQLGQAMLSIVSPRLWVTANFKETQLTHMHPGQAVKIGIDAYPGVSLTGHLDSIQRGSGAAFSLLPAQNATGNYVKVVQRVPVKIMLDDPRASQYVLGPGMSVVPEVDLQ